jgi:PleD family two-component response regulator
LKQTSRKTVYGKQIDAYQGRAARRTGMLASGFEPAMLEGMVTCEILIAAVDPATRGGIARTLAGASYNVRTTGTAAILWCWLQARKGDLVIVEATLPDEDTFELLPRIKKLRPTLPAIILGTNGSYSRASIWRR